MEGFPAVQALPCTKAFCRILSRHCVSISLTEDEWLSLTNALTDCQQHTCRGPY